MSIYSKRRSTKFIAIHCSATHPSQNVGAAEIRRWHRARGWVDIGYHFIIRRDGIVERGRPQNTIGAHVEGFNSTSVGVCLVGGVTERNINKAEDNFTPAQWAALKTLVTTLRELYPNAVVQGHRDFPKVTKACPSFDAKAWAKANGF
jgi:N-acetylmuramoyl-L-alanine amidase